MIRAATPDDPLRIAVLASGTGSNLASLLERLDDTVSIVGVASNRADAIALRRAQDADIETAIFPRSEDWAVRDRALRAWLVERRVELVVLAGFLELLTTELVDHLPVINVHPSLLPAFPGLKAWQQALDAGATETGVTVHFVDAGLDTGPIIAQEPVPIREGDDAAALHLRIQAVEHLLLPDVVRRLAANQVSAPAGVPA